MDSKYLIKQPEDKPEKTSLSKSYQLTTGSCEQCTLEFNCRGSKTELLRFLKSLGIEMCSGGFCYEIVEDVKKVVDQC